MQPHLKICHPSLPGTHLWKLRSCKACPPFRKFGRGLNPISPSRKWGEVHTIKYLYLKIWSLTVVPLTFYSGLIGLANFMLQLNVIWQCDNFSPKKSEAIFCIYLDIKKLVIYFEQCSRCPQMLNSKSLNQSEKS